MEAIYTAPLAQRRSAATTIRTTLASLASFVGDVLVASARRDDFERIFSNAAGAQFAALPTGAKDRHLNRGFRP